MNININKDFIKEYKDDFMRGFSLKECACIVTAFTFAAGAVFAIWKLTDLQIHICVYIAVPLMVPILAIGFYQYQGMSILQLLKEMYYSRKTSCLTFEAEEMTKEDQYVFEMEFKERKSDQKKVKKTRNRKEHHRYGND